MAYKTWEEELAAQNAELARLREQNLASQGQVSSTPFFGGAAYDPNAASAGTGRGALASRDGQIGYYGGGQWNSLGAMPAVGSPEWQRFVQQSSYEGDKEAAMMAQNAQMPAPTTKSYGYSQPPSWAQTQSVNTNNGADDARYKNPLTQQPSPSVTQLQHPTDAQFQNWMSYGNGGPGLGGATLGFTQSPPSSGNGFSGITQLQHPTDAQFQNWMSYGNGGPGLGGATLGFTQSPPSSGNGFSGISPYQSLAFSMSPYSNYFGQNPYFNGGMLNVGGGYGMGQMNPWFSNYWGRK